MKKLFLNLYIWPAFIFITLIGLFFVPFILLLNSLLYGRTIASSLRLAIRFYGWVLVCAIPFMAPVKVLGKIEKTPTPSIFVANHTSAIDPYLFGAIPVENCFVTSWPFKIPIYGLLMKLAGYIDIADGWDNMYNKSSQLLSDNVSITIWPEGHRSRDGSLGRFRKGAFQLSVETGCPIQPVCILGSGEIMSPGERLLNPGRVSLVLLDTLYPPSDDRDMQDKINELRIKTIDAIEQCILVNQTASSRQCRQMAVSGNQTPSEALDRHPHDFC